MNKYSERRLSKFLSKHLNLKNPEVIPLDYILDCMSEEGVEITSHEIGYWMHRVGNPVRKKYEWRGCFRKMVTYYEILRTC